MRKHFLIWGATAALAAVALLATPSRADFRYHVQMDTSALIGHPAGPFALDFQLVDGDGIAGNLVTLTGFAFGGGAPSGSPTVIGGALGDLSGGVTLSDTDFLNEFLQSFTPGNVVAFDLSTTSAFFGGIPDGLSFAILDSTGTELPTLGPAGAFFQIDLEASPTIQSFGSDPAQAPSAGGDPITIAAPAVSVAAPEPHTASLLAIAALPIAGFVRARRRR